MIFHPLRKFRQLAQSISLSTEEKTKIDTALKIVQEMHPVRKQEHVRQNTHRRISFLKPNYMFASLIVALALLISGGGAFAAEQSLPGDILYPVKIHVNEAVGSALAVGDRADAQWEEKIINRRLNEVAHLTEKGRLDEKTSAELTASIESHVNIASTKIASVHERGEDDTATSLRTDLEALLARHKGILSTINHQGSEKGDDNEHSISTTSAVRENHGTQFFTTSTPDTNLNKIIQAVSSSIGTVSRIIVTPSGNVQIQIKKEDRAITSTPSTKHDDRDDNSATSTNHDDRDDQKQVETKGSGAVNITTKTDDNSAQRDAGEERHENVR